jgi:Family of unknown function (DUF5686)/CarboxypepD_reg-like domain
MPIRISYFKPSFFIILALISSTALHAQETTVQGKVTDAKSGDPIPFANVYFKGTQIGITTDFDGNYLIKTKTPTDSLTAAYVGFKPRVKAIVKNSTQTINFQLEEDIASLGEVVVKAGENPAFEILRNVQRNKDKNDMRKLSGYEYDTYTKIEIDVDNISDKLREKKVMKKISPVLDSIAIIAGEDGRPILPMLITETSSKLYYRSSPKLKKEFVEKTRITGVGVTDGTTVAPMVSSSFQEYNFYENWISIVTKEFVSPIADVWRLYYDYDLSDSLMVDGFYCFRLDFFPRSEQDLAFSGTMWITKKEYALLRIDATVSKFANVNFIEKIKIQQELKPTSTGPWLPVKNRILIDVSQIRKNSAGMLAKFYTSNKNFVVDKPREPKFYDLSFEAAEDYRMHEQEAYWDTVRHEPLTEAEKNVKKMIDTLKSIPIIRTYTDVIKTVVDGYYDFGDFKFGPYLGIVSYNNVEGFRVMAGFKSDYSFSKKWVLGVQGAYGFEDHRYKYMASATRILDRRRWTTLSFRARKDIARLGVDDEALADNPLFLTATRWGQIRLGYYFDEYRAAFQREFFKGFTAKASTRFWTFDPTYPFGYYEKPPSGDSLSVNTFQAMETSVELRYAKDEIFLQDDNDRISLGTQKWPVISIRYTKGYKGVFGSDFNYSKVRINLTKRWRAGFLGVGYLTLSGEYVFNTLPYPLLSFHLGNQSVVYSAITYNLMNFGEFVSDRFVAIQYRHFFEGLFFNRIPLIKKLNWRTLATVNVLQGGMRQANLDLIAKKYPIVGPSGEKTLPVGSFETNRPYIELGYGIENIFRVFRVDFVHRLSYLEKPDVRKFGILFTAQFQL